VNEGARSWLERVDIEGNRALSDGEVKGMLHSRPRSFWRFRDGHYTVQGFEDDMQAVRARYRERGYLDADVAVALEAGSAPGLVRARVRVMEGPQYTVGRVGWQRQTVLNPEQMQALRARVRIDPGAPYAADFPGTLWNTVHEFLEQEGIETRVRVRSYISEQSGPLDPEVDVLISLEDPSANETWTTTVVPFAPTAISY
jgi:outer membrane protein assembly factor BamA